MNKFEYKSYDEYINCQIRHENTKIRTRSKSYKLYTSLIKERFGSDVKKILCIGARDEKEVMSFRNEGYDSLGVDLFSSDESVIRKIDMHLIDSSFGENDFDLVFSCHSLEHAFDPEKVLNNLYFVSRVGAFIVLPYIDSPTNKDPVAFDFMKMKRDVSEKDIELEIGNIIGKKLTAKLEPVASLSGDVYLISLFWNKES